MPLLADVVWPAMFLAGRLWTWWIIAAGLVIEWQFVRWLTQSTFPKAGMMTLAMNAISSLVGIIGIPLAGIIWELIAQVTVVPLFHWGTFNPVTWAVSCLLAALLNTWIETTALRKIFKVSWSKQLFWWLMLANLITVGMAMASIMLNPPNL